MIRAYHPDIPGSLVRAFRSSIPEGYVELPDGQQPQYATPDAPANQPAQAPADPAETTPAADANQPSKE